MKSSALERKSLVCFATLLVAVVPMIFTACGGGMMNPASTSQKTSAPTVLSVVPNTGPPAGGMAVTINGSNFKSGTQQASPAVSFGGVQATQVTVISSAQLRAIVPAHAAGSVSVEVTTASGNSSLASAFTYTTTSLSVKDVSPLSGPAAGGTAVTISGANFQTSVSVTFGGLAAASVTRINSSTIVAVTPPHSAGSATVTVTNSNGQSANLSPGFTFHSVDLVWNAPATSPVAITGYNVYRAQSSPVTFSRLNGATPVTGTSFNDPTVQGSTTYYYEVRSVDANGTESIPDGPVQATTGP